MQMPDVLQVVTYQEAEKLASSFLEKIQENPQEAQWLLMERNNWTITDWMKHRLDPMTEAEKKQFQKDLKRKAKGEPLQYILGNVQFLGNKFRVTPATLIPRPETEIWLKDVLDRIQAMQGCLDVLDIGTGTGVIAVSHKLRRPQDNVTGTDISLEALKVAKDNGRKLKADIEWLHGDLFAPVESRTFDLIYSNPPYIGKEELSNMTDNVWKYEPHEALFAEENGYQIYRKIAEQLAFYLNPGGQLYLEIGYLQAEKVTSLLREHLPQVKVQCHKDWEGRDRLIHVQMPKGSE